MKALDWVILAIYVTGVLGVLVYGKSPDEDDGALVIIWAVLWPVIVIVVAVFWPLCKLARWVES